MCLCVDVLMCWCVDVHTPCSMQTYKIYWLTNKFTLFYGCNFIAQRSLPCCGRSRGRPRVHHCTQKIRVVKMWSRFVSGDTVCTANCSTVLNVRYFTLIAISFYCLTTHFNESYLVFKLWSDLDTFSQICVLVLTTLKVAAWPAETCWWPLCNKLTAIDTKCVCWSVGGIFCVSKGRF